METEVTGIGRNRAGKVPWSEQELIRNRQLWSAVSRGVEMRETLHVRCPGTGCLDEALRWVYLKDLLEFRQPPQYRLICFTFSEKDRVDRTLISRLQYSRLLLRPGGRVALLMPGQVSGSMRGIVSAFFPVSRFAAQKSYPVSLLRLSGFHDVRLLVRQGSGRIVFGSRPASSWRDKR